MEVGDQRSGARLAEVARAAVEGRGAAVQARDDCASERRDVRAPGGAVLASTHGVQVYHPAPVDLWRWTHAGLDRLFRENGDWSSLSVRPSSGTTACLGMLVSIYADLLARRLHVPTAGRAVVAGLNRGAAALDRRSSDLSEPRSGSLIANYHVIAEP